MINAQFYNCLDKQVIFLYKKPYQADTTFVNYLLIKHNILIVANRTHFLSEISAIRQFVVNL